MFKCKQSSLPLGSGGLLKSAHCHAGLPCTHAGPGRVASMTSIPVPQGSLESMGCGACHLSVPSGGIAYGILNHWFILARIVSKKYLANS
jgi:hypothetical protein